MTILYIPEQSGEYDKGGLFWQVLAWVARCVVPAGSPDYNLRLRDVAYWLAEVDDDGRAAREIGFNAQHEPILFAPTNRNNGLWTDSDRLFSLEEFESRNEYPFEATWTKLCSQAPKGVRPL